MLEATRHPRSRAIAPAIRDTAAPGRRLERHTNNSSGVAGADPLDGSHGAVSPDGVTPHGRRWARLEWLRQHSVMRRQRICRTRAVDGVVSVLAGGSGATYGGLMACGSRLCPCCAPGVWARDRDALQQAVHLWREDFGGSILFGTFTVRHTKGMTFRESREALSAGWAAVTSGRRWAHERREHGVAHWVRVFEEKWSPTTGWHLHLHYLLFVAPGTGSQASHLLASMFDRWSRGVLAAGGLAPAMAGQDLHEVSGLSDTTMPGYLTKAAERAGTMTAARMAMELAAPTTKNRALSLTPEELLDLAIEGDGQTGEHARLLWAEYERGMKGRRVIAWSRGLREAVGVVDVDDETAAADGDQSERDSEVVAQLRGRSYKKLLRYGKRAAFLRRVETYGAESAVAWAVRFGLDAVVGTFDARGEGPAPDPAGTP